jgi:hypothetical protein
MRSREVNPMVTWQNWGLNTGVQTPEPRFSTVKLSSLSKWKISKTR